MRETTLLLGFHHAFAFQKIIELELHNFFHYQILHLNMSGTTVEKKSFSFQNTAPVTEIIFRRSNFGQKF